MSYPVLYTSTETAFDTNGIGALTDAAGCQVTEERNGIYELELQYPVTGIHFGDIALRSIILAKPNPYDDPQPFRVYRITRPLGGMVTVYAQHISYDLSGIVVSPFTSGSIQDAFIQLKSRSNPSHNFTFWTDKTTAATMTVSEPSSLRSLLGGVQGSVLDSFGGGDYKFDRYEVRLYGSRGADNGVTIRYGKNLTDLEQEENCQSVYTGVYPYWKDSEDNIVELSGNKIVNAEGTYNFTRIMPLDLSGEWEEKPTEDQLRQRAQRYIKDNNIGVPTVSLKVSFVQLEQTEEYKHLALFDRVSLCDTVTVVFPAMGVSATAKVVETVYNVLLDRYESVTIGDAKHTLADTIVEQSQAADKKLDDTKTQLQKAVDKATADITGNNGGYVVLHDSNGDKHPDELLVMDQPTIDTATHVWRWNQKGLGYSGNGYNGTYGTAITADGHIVANYVNTGDLTANVITTGILKADNPDVFYLDLDKGVLNMKASKLSITAATDFSVGSQSLDAYTKGKVDVLDKALTQQEVFNRLTNNKANQGIYLENGNLYINASMIHTGTLSANYIKGGTLKLGGASNGNGLLEIYNASNVKIGSWDNSGINAPAGKIGGWTLSANSLYSGTNSMTSTAVGTFIGQAGFRNYKDNTHFVNIANGVITAQGANITGAITATSGSFSGKITAKEGSIGGFTIGSSALYNGQSAFKGNANGVYLGTNGISLGANGKFAVDSTGKLTASDVSLTGTITASAGKIGKFNITSSGISTNDGYTDWWDVHGNSVQLDADSGINIGTKFGVNRDGDMYARSGTIGQMTINDYGYQLGSYGYMGYYSGSTDQGYSTTGVQIRGSSTNVYCVVTNGGARIVYGNNDCHAYQAGAGINGGGNSFNVGATITASRQIDVSSDRRIKNSIDYDIGRYEELFRRLKPVSYRLNSDESGKRHLGLIAQDLELAIEEAGLTPDDLAAFSKTPKEDDETDYDYGIAYGELIALNTHMIQRLYDIIDEIRSEIDGRKA